VLGSFLRPWSGVAFRHAADRWGLVVFLDKLPSDPSSFISAVEPAGTFRVDA
jgi:hypothetical protein